MSTTVMTDRLRSPRGPATSGVRSYARATWLGIGGIALALLAFFVVLPPLTLRTGIP
nr:hypothetical protein [Solirubrobacterales bacterium]